MSRRLRCAYHGAMTVALAVVPVCFVWWVELGVRMPEIADTTYTTGFFTLPPVKGYHLWMFLLFFVNWTTAIQQFWLAIQALLEQERG